jgi:hypothetical protein
MFSLKESLPARDLNRAGKDTSECEAVRCNAKATTTIAVPVGDEGRIFVFVCKKCAYKFKSDCYK